MDPAEEPAAGSPRELGQRLQVYRQTQEVQSPRSIPARVSPAICAAELPERVLRAEIARGGNRG